MQIRSINQSPSFAALRLLDPDETRKKLMKCSPQVLKLYQQAGNMLKDTEYFDVNVDSSLRIEMVSKKGAYWGTSYNNNVGRLNIEKDYLIVNGNYAVSRSNNGGVGQDGKVHYKIWDKSGDIEEGSSSEILEVANVAKILDDAAKADVEARLNDSQTSDSDNGQKSEMVSFLIGQYGVNN